MGLLEIKLQQVGATNVFRAFEATREVWFMYLESERQGELYNQRFLQL